MATASPDDSTSRFRAALAADPDADLADYLPPPDSPARPAVLLALITVDLEQRAAAGRPARVDRYLRRFPADLPADAVPVTLLYDEYRIRHRSGDAPGLAEYHTRFPGRYEEFRRYVTANPVGHGPTGTVQPPSDDGFELPELPDPTKTARQATAAPAPTATPVPRGPLGSDYPSVPNLPARSADYTFVRQLGKGAFGTVYLAEAPGGVPVAVKQINRGVDHPVGRSELEALSAIKKLTHPFLTQVHQFWVEGEQLFIVMDLADESLADRVAGYKERGFVGVPANELVPFFAQAAAALDYLRSKNVSHRDVKPQNLLSLKGYAMVADFGLARTHKNEETVIERECGTPNYMAPEVWKGRVSLQSDQYSLAASYVFARLGRPLFTSSANWMELGFQHVNADPDLDPLPAAEQAVLRRALAKEPGDRFPTCVGFTDALREAITPPPAVVRPTRRWVVVAAALLVAGLAAGGTYLGTRRPPDGPPAASWVPSGWKASGEEVLEADRDGKRLYRQIERTVGDQTVIARLVPADRADVPPSFYLTRDKVTNRLFAALQAAAVDDKESDWNRYVRSGKGPDLLPGDWKKGAFGANGESLGFEGGQADVPVVGVTAVEAVLIAAQLGGRLPTAKMWQRANGGLRAGWAADRLALGQKAGPWPVTRDTDDRTPDGVHQLASNGMEWTRDVRNDPLLTPTYLIAGNFSQTLVKVVGEGWAAPADSGPAGAIRSYNWHETNQGIGFRVALEQP